MYILTTPTELIKHSPVFIAVIPSKFRIIDWQLLTVHIDHYIQGVTENRCFYIFKARGEKRFISQEWIGNTNMFFSIHITDSLFGCNTKQLHIDRTNHFSFRPINYPRILLGSHIVFHTSLWQILLESFHPTLHIPYSQLRITVEHYRNEELGHPHRPWAMTEQKTATMQKMNGGSVTFPPINSIILLS